LEISEGLTVLQGTAITAKIGIHLTISPGSLNYIRFLASELKQKHHKTEQVTVVVIFMDSAASELQSFGPVRCNGICKCFSSVQLNRIEQKQESTSLHLGIPVRAPSRSSVANKVCQH
jgi:hypothetical protein